MVCTEGRRKGGKGWQGRRVGQFTKMGKNRGRTEKRKGEEGKKVERGDISNHIPQGVTLGSGMERERWTRGIQRELIILYHQEFWVA